MLLYTYNWTEIGMWILLTLSIITLSILIYKRLLKRFDRDNMNTKDYCVLYSLDSDSVCGEVEIYFTSQHERDAKILLLDQDMNEILVIKEGRFTKGGNIVRFDTSGVHDGNYFYALITENQKTTKKMRIQNN